MTSRQFSRPGRKVLRRTRVLRESRLSNAWRNAFFSLCMVAIAVYALSVTFTR
jgi:hypothetical protein